MTSTSENSLAFWEQIYEIQVEMNKKLDKIEFDHSIDVYNPSSTYAAEIHKEFVKKYLNGPKNTLLLGLNPGPNSSFKTGIAFVSPIRAQSELELTSVVNKPVKLHQENAESIANVDRIEKCESSIRLWRVLTRFYPVIKQFYRDNCCLNYCALAFFQGGINKNPWTLFPDIGNPTLKEILDICNDGLVKLIELINPNTIICIGTNVKNQVEEVKFVNRGNPAMQFEIIHIPHPSPLYLTESDWLGRAGPLLSNYYNDLNRTMVNLQI